MLLGGGAVLCLNRDTGTDTRQAYLTAMQSKYNIADIQKAVRPPFFLFFLSIFFLFFLLLFYPFFACLSFFALLSSTTV